LAFMASLTALLMSSRGIVLSVFTISAMI